MLDYKVVYASCTGNTGGLAAAVYQGLGNCAKDIQELSRDTRADDAATYLVGFWTDRGDCPPGIREFLKKLSGKRVLLFGTCGFGQDEAYYRTVEEHVKKHLPRDCVYLGCYLCQGKMPIAVRERYQMMLKDEKKKETAENMIRNFDRALLHPDQEDYQKAIKFVRSVCK